MILSRGARAYLPESRTSMTATLLGAEFVWARSRDESTSLVMRGSVAMVMDDIFGQGEVGVVPRMEEASPGTVFQSARDSHGTRQVLSGPQKKPPNTAGHVTCIEGTCTEKKLRNRDGCHHNQTPSTLAMPSI